MPETDLSEESLLPLNNTGRWHWEEPPSRCFSEMSHRQAWSNGQRAEVDLDMSSSPAVGRALKSKALNKPQLPNQRTTRTDTSAREEGRSSSDDKIFGRPLSLRKTLHLVIRPAMAACSSSRPRIPAA